MLLLCSCLCGSPETFNVQAQVQVQVQAPVQVQVEVQVQEAYDDTFCVVGTGLSLLFVCSGPRGSPET